MNKYTYEVKSTDNLIEIKCKNRNDARRTLRLCKSCMSEDFFIERKTWALVETKKVR